MPRGEGNEIPDGLRYGEDWLTMGIVVGVERAEEGLCLHYLLEESET